MRPKTIKLDQVCYTSVPAGVKETSGWQTMARPAGFDKVRAAEAHCSYTVPRRPRDRREDQMPVDYGFRYLDPATPCLYRIVPGHDEFDRFGNFLVHTLVFRGQADLDAVDADLPALFAWAREHRVFCDSWKDVRDRCPGRDFILPACEVPIEELRQWRRDRDGEPLAERLAAYPADQRRKLAAEALCVALAPPQARRPVIWIAPRNGLDNSVQDYAVLDFLFAALPHAWRRLATFSTYRRELARGEFQWYGLTSDGPDAFNEENRDYDYYILDHVNSGRSSKLPEPRHSWAQRVVEGLDDPPRRSAIGRDARVASLFWARSGDDVYAAPGFLTRAEQTARELVGPGGACLAELPRMLVDSRGHIELLDRVQARFDTLRSEFGADWPDQSAVAELAQGFATLVGAVARHEPESLDHPARAGAIARSLGELLDACFKAGHDNGTGSLLVCLRDHLTPRGLCDDVLERRLTALGGWLRASPDRSTIERVGRFLDPFLEPSPGVAPGSAGAARLASKQEEYRALLGGTILDALCDAAESLDEDLIRSQPEWIWEYCKRRVPADPEALGRALDLLGVVARRGGDDRKAAYLIEVAPRIANPADRFAALCHERRDVLVLHAPDWRAARPRLPRAWVELLDACWNSGFWTSLWECAPPPGRQGAFYQRLADELRDLAKHPDRARRFAWVARESGLPRLRAVLESALKPPAKRSQTVPSSRAFYEAWAVALDIVARHGCARPIAEPVVATSTPAGGPRGPAGHRGPPPARREPDPGPARPDHASDRETPVRECLDLLLKILAWEGCSHSRTLEPAASAFFRLHDGNPADRLAAYLRLARQFASRVLGPAGPGPSPEEQQAAWVGAFSRASNDPCEGIVVQSFLTSGCEAAPVLKKAARDEGSAEWGRRLLARALVATVAEPSSPLRDSLHHLRAVSGKEPAYAPAVQGAVRAAILDGGDPEIWLAPGQPGWDLLERFAGAAGRDPLGPVLDGPDGWRCLARLYPRAADPERREPLRRRLPEALLRALMELAEAGGGLSPRALKDLASLLGSLPLADASRNYREIVARLRYLREAIREADRSLWTRIDLAERLVLALWIQDCHLSDECSLWQVLLVEARNAADGEVAHPLADLALRVRSVEDPARDHLPRWEVRRLVRLASRLFIPRNPAGFARFLARLGTRGEETPTPEGCGVMALALVAYLQGWDGPHDPLHVADREGWAGRLKWFEEQRAWDVLYREAALEGRARWDWFEECLRFEAQEAKLPDKAILAHLPRNPHGGLLRRFMPWKKS
jgi:hypothetical protein